LAPGCSPVGHSGGAFRRVRSLVSGRVTSRYFRWPIRAASIERRSSTVKVSLQTRDPKEALRLSRRLSYSAQQLVQYCTERGMTFEEIRRLLTTHFSETLARRKLQIATNGRLTQLDRSALGTRARFCPRLKTSHSGPRLPGRAQATARTTEAEAIAIA